MAWLLQQQSSIKRVSGKIGFSYVTSKIDQLWPLTNELKTIQLSALNKRDWLRLKQKALK